MSVKKKPSYLLHRPSGQARVRIDGKDHYLGVFDSSESHERYNDLITAWLRKQQFSKFTLTVDDLVLLYLDFATGYYTKDGIPTSEITDIRGAVRHMVRLYGRTRACDFGPLKLKSVRAEMVKAGWCRNSINKQVHRIRRIFSWGVENEIVPGEILPALKAVAALKKGRTTAHDRPPIQPVSDNAVNATLPFLSSVVADMVRLERVTGMRPGEVCCIRPRDIDRAANVWIYRPASHKTQHHGRSRVIVIGPQGQAILSPYLDNRGLAEYVFAPVESERQRRAEMHAKRTTPKSYGNAPGTNRRADPQRKAGMKYTSNTYRKAIERACLKAFPPPAEIKNNPELVKTWNRTHTWAPNRLRHTLATEVRAQHGLEAAQLILGHANADVTQIYAERDLVKASVIMAKLG